jgi:hypothetical protein
MIQFSFSNGKEIFETSNALKLYILEREGYIPKAIITFPKRMYTALKLLESCEIKKDDALFFAGKIEYISIFEDEIRIELISFSEEEEGDDTYKTATAPAAELLAKFKRENPSAITPVDCEQTYPPHEAKPPESVASKKSEEELDLLEKFKRENPDLSKTIDQEQTTRVGEKKKTSIFKPDATPKNLDKDIIYGSLLIEKSNKDLVSKVNLSVSASWIRRIEGDLDITTKIANRFPAGKINTLTPLKLIDSWPKFGDRISNYRSLKQTKYFVGHSRLDIDKSMTSMTPPIEIEDIPPFQLKREFFDHKLSIFWGFDQFTFETINSKIINGHITRGIEKKISINLQNVQEYIEDAEEHSFFTSLVGKKILFEIYDAVRNYIVLSMRNIKISCELPLSPKTENLSCCDWINIQGFCAKITELEYNVTPFEKTIKLVAYAFDIPIDSKKALDIPDIERPKRNEFLAGDVIYDINIQNDADSQYRKLVAYISEQKAAGKINKSNYTRLIRSFLNEAQTKINVIAKPLKTAHCEKFSINTENVII